MEDLRCYVGGGFRVGRSREREGGSERERERRAELVVVRRSSRARKPLSSLGR